jgi:hypothetical protein
MRALPITYGSWAVAAMLLFTACGETPAQTDGAATDKRIPPLVKPESEPSVSLPSEQDGLSVVIQPVKKVFASNEPLEFKVVFHNVSNMAYRLPNQVNPALYNYWLLRLNEVHVGTVYTGGTILPMGGAPEAGEIKPVEILPDGTIETKAVFRQFGYIEGTLSFFTFGNRKSKEARLKIPPGTYQVSVEVRFVRYTDVLRPPARIIAAEQAIESDPVPEWKDSAILSNPVEITIAP